MHARSVAPFSVNTMGIPFCLTEIQIRVNVSFLD